MLLYRSFRDELVEQIQDSDPALYETCGKTKDEMLHVDNDLMDRMWAVYQKNIEDYEMNALDAFRDTLQTVLGIPAVS